MSIWSRIRNVIHPRAMQDEIREELDFHLEMDRLNGHGERESRLRLGNRARIEEEVREVGVALWLESVLLDARYGLRQVRKSPALSAAIVLSLAIGLGANVAIFALVDAALLKPLPIDDPDGLTMLEWSSVGRYAPVQRLAGPPRTIESERMQSPTFSEAVYRGFAAQQSAFASVVGFSNRIPMAIDSGAGVVEVGVSYVSANFFTALGVSPILGRSFLEDEDQRGREPVVVVSHRYWVGKLAGDRNILGRRIRVNSAPARVVGVAPPGFFGLAIGEWVDAYAPLSARLAFEPAQAARPPTGGENAEWWVRLAARLEAGASASSAAVEVGGLFRSLAAETTGTELEPRLNLMVEPGRRGFNSGATADREGRALRILMLLVSTLLLIICANVANLLLSRSVVQQRESAVRLALGAPRHRLFRQHVLGSGILTVLGGCLAFGFGHLLALSIHTLFQTGQNDGSAFDLQPDWRMLAYTTALSAFTALVFSVAPALRAARSDLNDSLRAHTRAIVGGRLRVPRLLVTAQLALTFTALVAAGLLSRSLENLNSVSTGFDARGLAYATINPYQAGYARDQVGPYLDQLNQDLEAIPGVLDVAISDMRPLQGGGRGTWVSTPGGPPVRLTDGQFNPDTEVNLSLGSADLSRTLGIPILAGRALEPRDGPRAPVAVVDQRFASRFFGGRNPVGEHFDILGQSVQVIGLAANARFLDLREETTPTVYLPYDPTRFLPGDIHFAIRAAIRTEQLAAAVRRVAASLNPAVPVTEFHTQAVLIERSLRSERLLAFVSGGFGIVALVLATIGLGGLLAYAVSRRTNEIGVRMALGAERADVIRMVLRDSMGMAALGLAIGLPAAYGVARFLEASLYGLKPVDPVSAGCALAVFLIVALTAAWIPARRAAGIDPLMALREE
jgi:predicted permease